MSTLNHVIEQLTPELYERLRLGVELGKWPDGTKLTKEQVASAMQLTMLYEAHYLDQREHLTIAKGGGMTQLSKDELKRRFQPDLIVGFKDSDF